MIACFGGGSHIHNTAAYTLGYTVLAFITPQIESHHGFVLRTGNPLN